MMQDPNMMGTDQMGADQMEQGADPLAQLQQLNKKLQNKRAPGGMTRAYPSTRRSTGVNGESESDAIRKIIAALSGEQEQAPPDPMMQAVQGMQQQQQPQMQGQQGAPPPEDPQAAAGGLGGLLQGGAMGDMGGGGGAAQGMMGMLSQLGPLLSKKSGGR